ncbi:MAG TPA: hypothetical protein VGM54_15730 [Chthoniobacter sp.]|jgi:hypothetical protein
MPDHSTVLSRSSSSIKKIGAAGLWGGLWLALLGVGMAAVLRYEFTAGTAGKAPGEWPVASAVHREPGRATLLMFAHPKCTCTQASMEELAGLIAENSSPLTVHVLFLKAEQTSDDWTQTSLWRMAAAIPGVKISLDDRGAEAARFGCETSGDVVLYDAAGRLAFHGGITSGRGHSGGSAGRAAISTLLAGNQAPRTQTPVYGCSLLNPRGASHCLP